MTKRLLITLLLPMSIFAQSFLISTIPLPKTYIQNLDPYTCDEECLQDYLDKGMVFSFLAHSESKLSNSLLEDARVMNNSILNIGSNIINAKIRVAMLLPYKKIGKYASTTTNAVFSYLITKNNSFELKSYKIDSEDIMDIQNGLAQIQNDGFNYVIAPMTVEGARNLISLNPSMNIYFPTVNKKDLNISLPNISFGAIDYELQSDMLLKEAVAPLVIFSDNSPVGQKLSEYQKKSFQSREIDSQEFEKKDIVDENGTVIRKAVPPTKVIQYSISSRTTNLEYYLKENENIINASFFVDTPIVKSGMIISQLTLYDANATNILSAQTNYDPLILSMTQYTDRKNMIIANSITEHNNFLIQTNAILDNDIEYDWINYSTTVGIDYIYHLLTNADREYNIPLEDNQMIYNVELIQPSLSKFIAYTPKSDND